MSDEIAIALETVSFVVKSYGTNSSTASGWPSPPEALAAFDTIEAELARLRRELVKRQGYTATRTQMDGETIARLRIERDEAVAELDAVREQAADWLAKYDEAVAALREAPNIVLLNPGALYRRYGEWSAKYDALLARLSAPKEPEG